MKNFLILTATICFSQIALCQTVPVDSVKYYEGKTITVCSKVQGTYESKTGEQTTFLNFGKPYPNQVFSVVIFESDRQNFKYNPAEFLKDKIVCVTGEVKIFKGKTELIVTSEAQVKIQN